MTIETMKLALDALESASNNEGNFHDYRYAATALRQAIQEAALQKLSDGLMRWSEQAKKKDPNVYGDGNVYRGQRSKDSTTKTLHYTEPLRNSWFKLTDAEVWDEWVRAVDESNRSNRELAFRFACAIEAKLKEKNT